MDGVVKTSILTAISAITVYAGLFYYLNYDDDKNKNENINNINNSNNNNNNIRRQHNPKIQHNNQHKKKKGENNTNNNKKNNKKKNKKKSTTSILNTSFSSSSSSSSSSSNSSDGLGIPYGSSSSNISLNNIINNENNNTRFLEQEDEDESYSHEISSSSSENDFTQNSPRTLQDHLKILKSDDLSNPMVIKKLDSVYVLLSIVTYSESLALLSYLNSVLIVVESLNSLLALEMITNNQNTLIHKLGILLGNLLQYPENQKKIIETRFISTLVNLINDDDAERSDFSLFCLFNLSSNEDCGTEIILSQGIKEIITLLESKKTNISLKKQCLHIILNMYLESKNLREMISSENKQLINILKSIQSQKIDISDLATKILQIDSDHQNYVNKNIEDNFFIEQQEQLFLQEQQQQEDEEDEEEEDDE